MVYVVDFVDNLFVGLESLVGLCGLVLLGG